MLSSNETPFAAVGFGDLHRDSMTMAVVTVRATYDLNADGTLSLAEQTNVFSDVYEGDTERTPLLHATDLVGYKPSADITLLGRAHSPGGDAKDSWTVAIQVGTHRASLRVHGPRRWEPTTHMLKPTWRLGAAEPVFSVPLDYRLASGGRYAGDPDGNCDPRNPIGPGLIHADWTPWGKPLRAPQIESEADPIVDPYAYPEPQGFGPVPPWWLWRERHCGRRDEAWQRQRLPQPPHDMDYRCEQVAHPNLTIPFLKGDEHIWLDGLTPGGGRLRFTLPAVAVIAHHRWFDGRRVTTRLTLDGLHLDLRLAVVTCPRTLLSSCD